MLLEVEGTITQPADVVYPLVRDEMDKIVPYMPDITHIDVLSREEQADGRIKMVNQWFSQPSNIPSLLQRFAKPELFSWKDYALWNDKTYSVDFELESPIANDLYDARGTNSFGPHPSNDQHTLIRIRCNLTIYPERMPGVPRLLAKKVQPMVENVVRRTLEPNLSSLVQGLTGYFADPTNQ
ncbi:MAG: hypothetical protein EP343_11585 [Deltaproteobacteria bacterium]|nr:MAG: hypothetical protein EP343_11585 [Deltaproteobacteria bacterium]